MRTAISQVPRTALLSMTVVVFAFTCSSTIAQEDAKLQTQNSVYGWQLMTNAERNEYRLHRRSLKTQREREACRIEHHRLMQERARERGVTLPQTPPVAGKGMGPGPCPAGGQKELLLQQKLPLNSVI